MKLSYSVIVKIADAYNKMMALDLATPDNIEVLHYNISRINGLVAVVLLQGQVAPITVKIKGFEVELV